MITRRGFLKAAGAFGMAAACSTVLAACTEGRGAASSAAPETDAPSSSAAPAASDLPSAESGSAEASPASSASDESPAPATPGSIVVYFSRAGYNYEVGYVKRGNTAVLADMIASKTGSDVFEIVPAQPYPEDYNKCLDVAIAERDANARPAYSGEVDLAPYETVYLGYPLWWRDLPMCVRTFLESHDWAGKRIRPFCTHGGMGVMGTVDSVAATCEGAGVSEPLSMNGATAQHDRVSAESAVDSWLG